MSDDEDTDGVAGDGSESGGSAGEGADAADHDTGDAGGTRPDAENADEGDPDEDADDADVTTDERVAELEAELADREERIAELEERLDDREDRIADLEDRLKRKQADFQNYKKRAERKREDLKERATEDLVERLLDVRDNLRRGLEADHEDVASLRDGVEMTLREFDRVLEEENVSEIAPDPGDEIDPSRHEVMMRVDADVPEDTVADLYAPGYQMADRVIRPAQVTVSTGPTEGEAGEAGDDGEETASDGGDPEATAEEGSVEEST
ncbi:nucleotide exchange factor GrpE [Halobacteriales archaeon QS_8_69_26]|nr:MAG: nucleotide exchange factor GrpE [Halobacteriales archaeon QS_8_69_26]